MDYHILDKTVDDKTVNCVFHIAVPDAVNTVGTNWRTAVKRSFNPVPVMDWNDGIENTAITNGEVWEVQKSVRFSKTGLTNQQRLAEVEAFYLAEKDAALQKLSNILDFFGKEDDI